jgi:VanZ family protein
MTKITYADKFFHSATYGLFSFILFFVLYFQNKIELLRKYPSTFTIIITGLFGILNEFFQIFVPNRTPNPLDVIANFLGSVIIVILLKFNINNLKSLRRKLL